MKAKRSCWVVIGCLGLAGPVWGAPVGTAFTYQGFIERPPGTPLDDACDFRFGLWDADTGGNEIGNSPQTKSSVTVTDGVFTIENLDFGDGSFDGTRRWLAIEVQCPGDANFTELTPRVAVTAAPHALALPALYTQFPDVSEPDIPNVIGGFAGNSTGSFVIGATISGGGYTSSVNHVAASFATIGGGLGNTVNGYASTVGGGEANTAAGRGSTIGGGEGNTTVDTGQSSSVWNTVAGGAANTASGHQISTVGGGGGNTASGWASTVSGGQGNTAGGDCAVVAGGCSSLALGDGSFAVGKNAHALHNGAFVWGGYADEPLVSSKENEFTARTIGGVRFFTDSHLAIAVRLNPGDGSWSSNSDRNLKENFACIDPYDVLVRLASIPITEWNFISQDASIRHMGPMAQDFYAAFGLGESDTHISTTDVAGVALAAIQALHQIVSEHAQEIETLRTRVESLESGTSDRVSRAGLPLLLLGLLGLAVLGRRSWKGETP